MKIVLFHTSYSQVKFNTYIDKILEPQLKSLSYTDDQLTIDIIVHNNSHKFTETDVVESVNGDRLKGMKYIDSVSVIHTDKNIGYFWGAQEAISDNFGRLHGADFVIHLNSNVFITNIRRVIEYLFENINSKSAFFINEFMRKKNNERGFKTQFTIFRPVMNFYKNYNNDAFKRTLVPRPIPEHMIKAMCLANNYEYTIIPTEFIPCSCDSIRGVGPVDKISVVYNISYYHPDPASFLRDPNQQKRVFKDNIYGVVDHMVDLVNQVHAGR
tara:strand:+ start:1962 stop:2771 length:810 start_codon:yes stop_codon:yes gene_type:complete